MQDLIELINSALPQYQCGRCDTPGCRPYAKEIAEGSPYNRCVPGGKETLDKLQAITKRSPLTLDDDYGPALSPQIAYIVEDECIGCKKCIDACPVDAIVGSANMMHSIIDDICTGCELCIEPCPVDCIEIVSVSENQIKQPRDLSQFFYNLKETTNTKKRSKLKNFSNENLNISKFINNQIENRGVNKSENLNDMQVNITKNDLQNLHKFDESLLEDFVKNKSD
jgi:electron transport complex protein RnfB